MYVLVFLVSFTAFTIFGIGMLSFLSGAIPTQQNSEQPRLFVHLTKREVVGTVAICFLVALTLGIITC